LGRQWIERKGELRSLIKGHNKGMDSSLLIKIIFIGYSV